MAFSLKPLNQSEYSMAIVEDLGITFNSDQTRKSRYAIVECTECKSHFKLRMGSTKAKEQTRCITCALTKHGTCSDPLYAIWNGIKQRCYSPARKDFHKYGGKGVTMCDEWKDNPKLFIDWCRDNGWTPDKVVDKDIKSKLLGINPPIYSPETITFVSIQENAEAANSKLVKQYDLQDNYIATYDSCTKAALSLGKPKSAKSAIANCCRGVTKSSFGFKWAFA